MRRLILIAVCLALAGSALAANTLDYKFFGQLRMRAELDDRDLDSRIINFAELGDTVPAVTKSYLYFRGRLGAEVILDSNVHIYGVAQESRTLGQQSGNIYFHNLFFQVDRLWAKGPTLRVGRFDVNFGNGRLFAASNWGNTNTAFEGAEAWYARGKWKLMGLWLKVSEKNSPVMNEDADLLGLHLALASPLKEAFFVLENQPFPFVRENNSVDMIRITAAAFINDTIQQVDFISNLAYQFGTSDQWRIYSSDGAVDSTRLVGADLSAFLITAELGVTLPGASKTRLAAGIDYTSGDSETSDDTYEAFNNLYWFTHAFRGYMDYFTASNPEGMADYMARLRTSPWQGWDILFDAHYFQTAASYRDFRGKRTKRLGPEFDLVTRIRTIRGATLENGVGLFFPSESFAGVKGPKATLWGYTQIIVSF